MDAPPRRITLINSILRVIFGSFPVDGTITAPKILLQRCKGQHRTLVNTNFHTVGFHNTYFGFYSEDRFSVGPTAAEKACDVRASAECDDRLQTVDAKRVV